MQENSLIIVLTTVDKKETANSIAELLVKEKLAACVNILPGITSFYFWKEKLCNENEILMLIKTRSSLFNSVKEFLSKVHPYELPEIVAIPVSHVLEPFGEWVKEGTKQKK